MAEDRQTAPNLSEPTHRLTQAELDARRASRRASQQRRRRNSVFQYIAILFMAAFVLLLYTFMMERRQSQQQIDDLKQSASTVQTLQGLMNENSQLKENVNQLNSQIKELNRQLDAAQEEKAEIETQAQESKKVVEAMSWFWQLSDASLRGHLTQCRTLITSMEEAGMPDYLPKESVIGEESLSPAERYTQVYNRVMP